MISNISELKLEAVNKAHSLSLSDEHIKKLEFEFSQIQIQGAEAKWLGYYNSNIRFSSNPNKLILPFVLGLTQDRTDPLADRKDELLLSTSYDDITAYITKNGALPFDFFRDSDVPDVDLDCLPAIRNDLKDYATKRFSEGTSLQETSVCSVGTWQTYKFCLALADAGEATGEASRSQVQRLTTMLPPEIDELGPNGTAKCTSTIKQDDKEQECGFVHKEVVCPSCGGKESDKITFGQALLLNDDLKKFQEYHPTVVSYALRMIGRIRNSGTHAGALIVSDRKLFGNLPMGRSSSKNSQWVSYLTEGMNQELSKLGYVKYDVLGLKTLGYIYEACKAIEKNRNIKFGIPVEVEGREGTFDLEGIEYNDPELRHAGYYIQDGVKKFIDLDDPESIGLANDGKLQSVFQFDTPLAIRTVSNGSEKFEDLLLYSGLGHPGALLSVPDAVKNKNSQSQQWKQDLANVHPAFLEILESTYGVLCWQESLQAIWQLVAGFTSVEAQKARKAVAKKKGAEFQEVQKKWIAEASKVIGEEQAKIWEEKMQGFARYAFNKCLAADTVVEDLLTNRKATVKQWFDCRWMPTLLTLDDKTNTPIPQRSVAIHNNGIQEVFNVTFSDNTTVRCTAQHKFLCEDGQYVELQHVGDKKLKKYHILDEWFEFICGRDCVVVEYVGSLSRSTNDISIIEEECGDNILVEIVLKNGKQLIASNDTDVMTLRGYISISSLVDDDMLAVVDGNSTIMCGIHSTRYVTGPSKSVVVRSDHKILGRQIVDVDGFMIARNSNNNRYEEQLLTITSIVPAGTIDVYTFEMPEPNHNYILDGLVHKNSHAVSYTLIAFRCLWLKAHFFPEWMAAVLNDCHSKKIPRYIQSAIAEKWQPTATTKSCKVPDEGYDNFALKAFDINNLSANFSANGNVLTMGLLLAKGVGDSSLNLCEKLEQPITHIKEFIDKFNPKVIAMNVLIKLGAFDFLPNHQNRHALLEWYEYYTKKNKKPSRDAIDQKIYALYGWDDVSICAEINRQSNEFRETYPKRSKIPPVINNWRPVIDRSVEEFSQIFQDYSKKEILQFEKESLGYTISDPMEPYKRNGTPTIKEIREIEDEPYSILECVVVSSDESITRTGKKFMRVVVRDESDTTTIFIWEDDIAKLNLELFKEGRAITIPVRYNKERDCFNFSRYYTALPMEEL